MTARRGRGWRETQVRLASATLTTFAGPGRDLTVVLHGKRDGAANVTRQRETSRAQRSTTKGGR
jgi:hypothetical protein